MTLYKEFNNPDIDDNPECETELIPRFKKGLRISRYNEKDKALFYQIMVDNEDLDVLTGFEFQEGPVKQDGANGIHIETLLVICMDSLVIRTPESMNEDCLQDAKDGIEQAILAINRSHEMK